MTATAALLSPAAPSVCSTAPAEPRPDRHRTAVMRARHRRHRCATPSSDRQAVPRAVPARLFPSSTEAAVAVAGAARAVGRRPSGLGSGHLGRRRCRGVQWPAPTAPATDVAGARHARAACPRFMSLTSGSPSPGPDELRPSPRSSASLRPCRTPPSRTRTCRAPASPTRPSRPAQGRADRSRPDRGPRHLRRPPS